MKNKKLLTIAGITSATAAGAVGTAYITTKLLMKTALDREEPKIMKKAGKFISGSEPDEQFRLLCKEASDSLKKEKHETVKIVNDEGLELVGHFYPAPEEKRMILAFHGWRSSWERDFGLISDFWHKNGCSVLYAEQRGQNNSGGEHMGFGLTERYDCKTWSDWAVRRTGGKLPIYLAGISMGAATVLMASDLNLSKKVHGIMADCGFTSPKAIWKYVASNNLHMSYNIRSVFADAICKHKISMASESHSTIKALQNTDIPVLFVHGTDDRFVPVEMTYENYKACVAPKRLLIVPGADHAMSYYVDKKNYEKAVLEFWNDFDTKSEM